jgi:hypothetical protein
MPHRRKMSVDNNSVSKSDETWSNDKVQGAGMPISGFSFHFPYILMFLHIHVYVEVEVEILDSLFQQLQLYVF